MRNDKILKELSILREFLTYADRKNYPVCKDFFEFKPKLVQSKKDTRYLSVQELEKIINLDLPIGSALDRVRDFFVFQCFTALRYSDFCRLTHDNFKELSAGKYELDVLTKKDKDRIPIPLSSIATKIYLKYKSNIYDNNAAFPAISNQKYNEHLKELGKKAGLQGEWVDYQYRLGKIEEVIIPKTHLTSHSARRTFVVLAMNQGISLDVIAQITSHGDIKAMKPYIAVTDDSRRKVIDALDSAITLKRD